MEKLTKEQEFKVKMLKLKEGAEGDTESCHSAMDALMCSTLRELGFGAGVDVFHDAKKWYA